MDLGPGVVEEGVIDLGVEVEFDVESEILQLCFESGRRLRAEVVVAFGDVGEDVGPHLRVVGLRLGPGYDPVERHAGGDGVRPLGGQYQGQSAAHAEPDHTDGVMATATTQLVHGTGHVASGPVELHGHHLFAGLVGFGRLFASVQVGCEGGETGGGEPVADVLDVGHETPPLLD